VNPPSSLGSRMTVSLIFLPPVHTYPFSHVYSSSR
jgi:hypothetical protein